MAGLLAACGGCVLFTDDINEPPRVLDIEPAGGRVFRGPQQFTARVADDQDDPSAITLEWASMAGDCPPADTALAGVDSMTGPTYQLTLRAMGKVCVRVVAIDHNGARAALQKAFAVGNREPEAKLIRTARAWPSGKVRLYAMVQLSDESVDPDGDTLTRTFSLTRPDGTAAAPAECAPAQPTRRCFAADKPGHYEAGIAVSDGQAPLKTFTLPIDVDDDHPACLLKSDPAPFQPVVMVPHGGKRAFEVLEVDDDGEPYPALPARGAETVFVWSKGAGGEVPARIGATGPVLTVTEGLFENPRPGDQFRIRLEVRDRLTEERLQQRLIRPPCAEETDVCEVDGCLRWTTWKVQFFP
jgi:hypothetical protein